MKSGGKEDTFVYAAYIRATPEKVWEALTSGTASEKYWFGFRVEGEWKKGGRLRVRAPKKIELDMPNKDEVRDITGTVLECEPPKRLTYTFDAGDRPAVASKRREPSRVTYELTPMGQTVKLRLIHENLLPEDLEKDPRQWRGVNNGWPAIISSLKSLLETGSPIDFKDEERIPERAAP